MTAIDELSGSASRPEWLPHFGAAIITFASVAITTLLWRKLGAVPNPEVLLLLTVTLATFVAGGVAGMVSAAIVLASSFVLYAHPAYSFRYSEMDWRQAMLVVVAAPLIALMVGSLKEQVQRLQVVTAENDELKAELERQRRVTNALYLCEERYRAAADCVKEYAIAALDANGMVKTWNRAAEAITGYGAREIEGLSYARLFIKDDILARQPDRLLEMAQFSGRVEEEGWRLTKSGARIHASTVITVLKTPSGIVSGYLLVMTERSTLAKS